jgi:SAM-dependent methyltransferase
MTDLEFTGERVVPEKVNRLLWFEHMARYLFATPFVQGRVVLDAGCGAGYGADWLAAHGAKAVVGVDCGEDAIAYARSRYRRSNLEYHVREVTALGLPNRSCDVAVSFEVIEHLERQEVFVAEIARVLTENGLFLVSTPNRDVYLKGQPPNPFHVREFDLREFSTLLGRSFHHVHVFGQSYMAGIAIAPVHAAPRSSQPARIDHSLATHKFPLDYFIALCSNGPRPKLPEACQFVPMAYGLEMERDIAWSDRRFRASQELSALISEGKSFILVDEDKWETTGDFLAARRRIPFPERDGQYWGKPADDEEAVGEFERLHLAGADFMVFAWPAFWWLDSYRGLHRHLRARFPCVLENDRLVVFDLRRQPS